MPVNLNGMDPRVLAALKKLQEQARTRGLETSVISGFRLRQDQEQLYANYMASQRGDPLPYPARGHVPLAAAPGTSPHERGLAFDLQAKDPSRQSELWSLAPSVGLRSIGSNDPNHFELEGSTPSMHEVSPSSNPVYSGLIARGFSAPQAYALMGNMQQESNFNPSAFNEKEGAFGLLQWRQDRRANLQSFAASQGKRVDDLNTQLDFIKYETTKGAEAGNASAFYAANDVGSANAALKNYIRYGDDSEGTRLANAQAYAGGKAPAVVSAGGGVKGDWQSLLGVPDDPGALDLGSIMGDAVTSTSKAAAPAPAMQVDDAQPQIDQNYALAAPPPEDPFGPRYQQGRETRKLSPLGQLFSLPTIGLPTQPQPQPKTKAGPQPYVSSMGIG